MEPMNYRQQADILTVYLTKQPVAEENIYDLYKEIASQTKSTNEDRLFNFAFKYPRLIPALDAGLVFVRPTSELRRRIYVIFSILESHPQYADVFLPQKFTFLQTVGVFAVGVRAIARAVLGIVIIKIGRL